MGCANRQQGFSLIELVVGMVLLAIALTSVLGLLINLGPRSVDPVQQLRAAQLAERLGNEILQRHYDEQSPPDGRFRCGETVPAETIPPCSAPASYGPDQDELSPYQFDDVDDFDTGGHWQDASFFTRMTAGSSDAEYRYYQIRIAVTAVDLYGDLSPGADGALGKRITLTVRDPADQLLDFSFYRGNY
ncbi:type IV pilus modification PilV family protein [Aeromonas sp. 164P]